MTERFTKYKLMTTVSEQDVVNAYCSKKLLLHLETLHEEKGPGPRIFMQVHGMMNFAGGDVAFGFHQQEGVQRWCAVILYSSGKGSFTTVLVGEANTYRPMADALAQTLETLSTALFLSSGR